MKAVTKSNWGSGIHIVALKCVKPWPTSKTSIFNLHKLRNDMMSKVRLELKNGENISAKGTKKVLFNKIGWSMVPFPRWIHYVNCYLYWLVTLYGKS